MKVRTDLIDDSNSSFIGVFARITDPEKSQKVINQHRLHNKVKSGKEIMKDMSQKHFWGYGADWANVDLTPDKNEISEIEEYIIWESYGSTGENEYVFKLYDGDEELWYCNYDVGFSDFEKYEQEIYDALNQSNGFGVIRRGYGVGRNIRIRQIINF